MHYDTIMRRFWERVDIQPNGCWLWKGQIDPEGFGRATKDGHLIAAHRYAYELLVGPIPQGKVLIPTCGCKICVNPEHMKIGDQYDRHTFKLAERVDEEMAYAIRLKRFRGASEDAVISEFSISRNDLHKIMRYEIHENAVV